MVRKPLAFPSLVRGVVGTTADACVLDGARAFRGQRSGGRVSWGWQIGWDANERQSRIDRRTGKFGVVGAGTGQGPRRGKKVGLRPTLCASCSIERLTSRRRLTDVKHNRADGIRNLNHGG